MFWHDLTMWRATAIVSLGALGACGFSPRDAATPEDASTDAPVVVDAPPDAPTCAAVEVEAGAEHTCARMNDGTIYCWGRGANGELGITPLGPRCMVGNASYYCSTTPQKVDLAGVTSLGLGQLHSCATTSTGTYCWGLNTQGEFGDGTTVGQQTPRLIVQRAAATVIAGGADQTCSIAGAVVSCSGQNFAGEVGNGTMTIVKTATMVAAGITSLGIGDYTTCGVDGTQHVQCWGRNAARQIDPSLQNKLVATVVAGIDSVTQVAAARDHVCAVRSDHTLACWGSNAKSQLGDGLTSSFFFPPQAVPLPNVVEVSAERFHSCARDAAGAVWCWGESYTPAPTQIALPRPAIQITSGTVHDCAVTDDGRVWCWGNQEFGQLGNGVASGTRQPTPQAVAICP